MIKKLNLSIAVFMLAVAGAIALSPNAAAQDMDPRPWEGNDWRGASTPLTSSRVSPIEFISAIRICIPSYSTDAGMFGTRLGPDEAYRFARGEEVTSNTGLRVRLQRPLDFLVISDHAENLGLATMIGEFER